MILGKERFSYCQRVSFESRQTNLSVCSCCEFLFQPTGKHLMGSVILKKNARESSVQTELLLLVRVKWDATMGGNQIRLVRDKVK